MIRRVLLVSVAVLVAVLGLASPAAAKGPLAATVSGPGLTAPKRFVLQDEPGVGLALLEEVSRLWDTGVGGRSTRPAPTDPGPVYTISYDYGVLDGEPRRFRQDLYPRADSWPVVYTPPGQSVFESTEPATGGWMTGPANMVEQLAKLGIAVPPKPARPVPAAVPAAAPAGGSGAPGWLLPAGLLALLALGGGSVLIRRRLSAA
jgi:hypothetical protein